MISLRYHDRHVNEDFLSYLSTYTTYSIVECLRESLVHVHVILLSFMI